MRTIETGIEGLLVLEPTVFGDERGFFLETYNRRTFGEIVGRDDAFVQDNLSRSRRGVLRGLHYQVRRPQGKLVRVVAGEIFDVAVDLRRSSATFGRWYGTLLSAAEKRAIWVPPEFAHGFLVRSEFADVLYKTTDFYDPEHERAILWDDPDLGVAWPLDGEPILSDRDRVAGRFRDAEVFP